MKHDCITKDGQETAALYALGALSQHEARAFEVHLREGCPACDVELKQFEQVTGLLGTTAAAEKPPAYLRDLLSVRIQREILPADWSSTTRASTTVPPSMGANSTLKTTPSPSVIPFRERKPPSSPSSDSQVRVQSPGSARPSSSAAWLPWAVAAMLFIAFLASFSAWRSEHRSLAALLDQDKESTSAALKENAELKAQLTKEAAISTEMAQINSVLSSPQVQTIDLAGQEPAPNSSAKVYWDVQGARWVVSANLPPAPDGKVYQLWFVTPEAKISAGLISPDVNGHGFTVVQFPSSITQLDAAAITLEPQGGSEQPTMPIYAVGKSS